MSSTAGVTIGIGAAIGLALAIFGVRILVTGRAPDATARAFRSLRDAGCYHLLFGVALGLVVVGTGLPGGAARLVTILPAIAMVAVAVVRFRPRGRHSAGEGGHSPREK
jgi:hypothetical protein